MDSEIGLMALPSDIYQLLYTGKDWGCNQLCYDNSCGMTEISNEYEGNNNAIVYTTVDNHRLCNISLAPHMKAFPDKKHPACTYLELG
jgi:predicted DNA-binding protein YlxM (UPF0122 family)